MISYRAVATGPEPSSSAIFAACLLTVLQSPPLSVFLRRLFKGLQAHARERQTDRVYTVVDAGGPPVAIREPCNPQNAKRSQQVP